MSKSSKHLGLFCSLFLAHSASAVTSRDVGLEAQKLPKGSFDLYDHGRLCESLGVQKIHELMPDAIVYNGVEYRQKKRVIGELDLVVVQNNLVTHVIEVKCMAAYKKASHKADEQLDRFSQYADTCKVDFSLHGTKLPCSLFQNPHIQYGKMSYSDARSAGFDFDFSLTRQQVMQEIKKLGSSSR